MSAWLDEQRANATAATGASAARERVVRLMPELKADLVRLARIPSIAFPGYPPGPLLEAHSLVAGLLRDAGAKSLQTLSLPDTAPIVTGEIPAPDGAPTVLLYAHYDVQPAGDERLWATPPFDPTERDGAIFGRGVADDKANVIAHVGALRAFDGRPPVGIKLLIEGQEEYGSALDGYPLQRPELFRADAMLVGDAGSVRPGVPTLTTALRGDAELIVELRALAEAKHSGEFGGAAPDALIALTQALATLHDQHVEVLGREARALQGVTSRAERQREGVLPLVDHRALADAGQPLELDASLIARTRHQLIGGGPPRAGTHAPMAANRLRCLVRGADPPRPPSRAIQCSPLRTVG